LNKNLGLKKHIRYTYHGIETLGESGIGLAGKELTTSAAAAVDGTQFPLLLT
jgi:hypothetical protein